MEPPGFNINADERKKVTDPAIKQVLKEIPYFSRQRASLEHLNGVVNFADPLYSEKKIVCRHLSTHRILNMANHKMGKYRPIPSNNTINALLDENSVRENVHYFIEKQYQKIKINPIEVHLVKNSSFGKALIHQFQTMINNIKKAAEPNKKDEAVRYIILESLNHSMSLRLCIKRNPEGTDYYVVEFFDPNMTVNHIRVSNTVLNNLKLFTLRDLFFQINTKTSYYNIYYPEGNQFSILNVTGTAQETLNSLKKNNSKKPNLTSGGDLENSIEKISYLIIDGFHENLIELANELKEKIKKNEINPNEITRIIGLEVSDGCPILYTAMLQGNTNIIKAYGELLKLIPANTRASFLAAKGPEGFPSFLIATAMGHTELIKAFGQLLILIPECDSINLLFPKNFEENSVISTALRNNKTEAAVAWGEVILKTIKNKEVHLDFQKKVHEFYSPSNNSNQNTMTPERRIDYQRILSSVEEKRPSSLLHSETPNKKPKT